MILLDIIGDVTRCRRRQHEECVDDQDADPLDADGYDDSQDSGKHPLHPKGIHATAARKRGIDRENQQLIVEQSPAANHQQKDQRQRLQIFLGDAQHITDKKRGKLIEAAASCHDHKAQSNRCR